ncbi:CNPV164 hypothetical protein [Canarypox virus]|uniref:Uncharacterized protein CNPV164 n=1 Tax=Canarypox virus TaxID=44088 RepID=Q6VZI4_CNPV|nr:CNPV164 hypothetical protein [Canarypox virus]AAR83509.1 CNPV164 hypothetical protein [Canarypox virus]AWD84639.1 hypothetical protein CNPV164 [Canarypox virus]
MMLNPPQVEASAHCVRLLYALKGSLLLDMAGNGILIALTFPIRKKVVFKHNNSYDSNPCSPSRRFKLRALFLLSLLGLKLRDLYRKRFISIH